VWKIRDLILESSSLVGPQDGGLFSLGSISWNGKEILNELHTIEKGSGATGKQIQRNDTLGRPSMKGNMRLEQDTSTAHSSRSETMTMIR
jgi:hypothetical protein